MARAHLRAILVGLSLALVALGLSACGSSSSTTTGGSGASASSPSTSASATTTSSPESNRLGSLLRALRRARATPAVSNATCVAESQAQRAKSPFGPSGPPVFACQLQQGGAKVAYDVQLLPSGCYVAERRKPGKAIYGCGAAKA